MDNMWLQGIAACLPRVADEWDLTSAQSARLSSFTFLGMLSTFAWGICESFVRSFPSFLQARIMLVLLSQRMHTA